MDANLQLVTGMEEKKGRAGLRLACGHWLKMPAGLMPATLENDTLWRYLLKVKAGTAYQLCPTCAYERRNSYE